MNKKVLNKINEISDHIDLRIKNNNDISLINGIGSLPVYYFLMFKLTNDNKFINKIHTSLDKIIDIINETDTQISYCNGLIGVAYMFNYIKNKNVLTSESLTDIEDALLILDETILELSLAKTKNIEDVDFLHGSFGGALYLIERYSEDSNQMFKNKVKDLFEKLAQIVLDDIKKTKKVSNLVNSDESTHKTNCGLAHGHPSYIIIISKFMEKVSVENQMIKDALTASIDCLLGFQSIDENSFAQFPSIAVNRATSQYNIPLGWCYGDQTISLALYKASVILKSESLRQKALDLAYTTLRRDSIDKIFPTSKYDAGFCHGLSSVAYINKKWFILSKDEVFYKQYEKYIVDIINYGNKNIGVAGYQKYLGKDRFIDSIGFLDGAIGIGIVLIDYLLGFEDEGWDSFFLLDIK